LVISDYVIWDKCCRQYFSLLF